MIKTPFITLKERVLIKDKTVIPKDLSAGEGELINLVTNNNNDNNLRKNITPKKSINSPIIFNFDAEISEINHHGINFKAKFWELNFTKQIINLIPKTPNEQHKSISILLNWL